MNCQYLTGHPIDEAVVQGSSASCSRPKSTHSNVSTPSRRTIGANWRITWNRRSGGWNMRRSRAERQYDSVDPENRLIAATLEKRWEEALAELDSPRPGWPN